MAASAWGEEPGRGLVGPRPQKRRSLFLFLQYYLLKVRARINGRGLKTGKRRCMTHAFSFLEGDPFWKGGNHRWWRRAPDTLARRTGGSQ